MVRLELHGAERGCIASTRRRVCAARGFGTLNDRVWLRTGAIVRFCSANVDSQPATKLTKDNAAHAPHGPRRCWSSGIQSAGRAMRVYRFWKSLIHAIH